jgi:hypothetical protein
VKKMRILAISGRVILCLMIITGSLVFSPKPANAWEQGTNGTHEAINREAVVNFFNLTLDNPKYLNSPIDKNQTYLATAITSSSLQQEDLTIVQKNQTFSQWLIHGGFSADESHFWASVRHFFNPIAENGPPELTDHSSVHGQVYQAISAKDWASGDYPNPYSWKNALEYYKKSMEIWEEINVTVVPGSSFREQDIPVSSPEQARNAYLGKAFRALGETMHMMADMTQPCHVRNDSHPGLNTLLNNFDPVERSVNSNTVMLYEGSPVEPEALMEISTADNAMDMFTRIALYTNKYFYTQDTIYDKASKVMPNNDEKPYDHPQFSELTLVESSTEGPYYIKQFNGKNVRLIAEKYSSWKNNWDPPQYLVPPSFANDQAEALIPITIKANANLIDLFFPTMDLKLETRENSGKTTASYKEYELACPFKHNIAADPDWQKIGEIQYSGPGELWVESGKTTKKLGDLIFRMGNLEKSAAVYVGDMSYAKGNLYNVKANDIIYVVVKAGGRTFQSNKYTITAQQDLTITPAEVKLAPGGKQTFIAKLNGVPGPDVIYTIDEGAEGGDLIPNLGTYIAPAKTGIYHVTATLRSDKTKKATATIKVVNAAVAINPAAVTLAPNEKQIFTAEVTGIPGTKVSWRVDEAFGGIITETGEYTAPSNEGQFHVVAVSVDDDSASASATVSVVSKPKKPSNIAISISPTEIVLVPGQKQEFRATLSGTDKTEVMWSGPGPYLPPQDVIIPVTFVTYTTGEYTVVVTGGEGENSVSAEAKMTVISGTWVLKEKKENYLPDSSGDVTLNEGTAMTTDHLGDTISHWSYTWTIPPEKLPVGEKFTGTLSVQDRGTSYDPESRIFPLAGLMLVISGEQMRENNVAMASAGREMHVEGFPFTSSGSSDFSFTIPAGTLYENTSEITIRISVGSEIFSEPSSHALLGAGDTQSGIEILYIYELKVN